MGETHGDDAGAHPERFADPRDDQRSEPGADEPNHDAGLVDRIVEGELLPHAVAFAEEVRDIRPLAKSSERQDRLQDVNASVFEDFRKANARKFKGFDAPDVNVRAVQVATQKPYSEGVIEERKLFMEQFSLCGRHTLFPEKSDEPA